MWQYWELLTDRSLADIADMKRRISMGELHPMDAKMELGRIVVSDFHSAVDAERALQQFVRTKEAGKLEKPTVDQRAEDDESLRIKADAKARFDRVAPANISTVPLPEAAILDRRTPTNAAPAYICNTDKLVAGIGLASSVSEASRKRKEGAVIWNGIPINDVALVIRAGENVFKLGKNWRRVVVPPNAV